MTGGTLDTLLRGLAASRPYDEAIACPSNREAFTEGAPRRLSWAVLDSEVEVLAGALRGLGLSPRAVVAVQLPSICEAIIAVLAVLRAGHVVSTLPLFWDRERVSIALVQAGAEAVITTSRIEDRQPVLTFLEATAGASSVRHLLSFGSDVPRGVIALDRHLQVMDQVEGDGSSDCHAPAVITWGVDGDALPVRRSQSELLAASQDVVQTSGLASGDVVINTLMASSLAGLATGIGASLSSGARLVLHQPFDWPVFAAAMPAEGVTHLVAPGRVVEAMWVARRFADCLRAARLRTVCCLWREDQGARDDPPLGGPSVVDVRAFGEIGLVAAPRDLS